MRMTRSRLKTEFSFMPTFGWALRIYKFVNIRHRDSYVDLRTTSVPSRRFGPFKKNAKTARKHSRLGILLWFSRICARVLREFLFSNFHTIFHIYLRTRDYSKYVFAAKNRIDVFRKMYVRVKRVTCSEWPREWSVLFDMMQIIIITWKWLDTFLFLPLSIPWRKIFFAFVIHVFWT